MTALRVRYDARDLESAVGARRLLGRIGAAAQEVCGASSFSLPEVKAAVRASQCWRKSVDDAVGSIDSPLLNAAARGKAALTRLEEPGRQMDAWRTKHYPAGMRTISYGPLSDQSGDLYLPAADRPPVVCLLHGGFWRLPWGRDNIAPIAVDLMRRGYAVWNLEYRRVAGNERLPGDERLAGDVRPPADARLPADGVAASANAGGWPATLQDVGAGIDHLALLAADGVSLDLNRVTVVGHSAGGHLALWSARRDGAAQRLYVYQPQRIRIAAAVGLAPVADLRLAYELQCGRGAVRDFLGGSPEEYPSRYGTASPAEMLPLGVTQLLIHGTLDEDVPIEISRRYCEAAAAAGDDVHLIELAAAAHMDFVDPATEAHAVLCGGYRSGTTAGDMISTFSGRSENLHRR